MALPQIDIPAHVADQHGYNLTRGIASDLRDTRDRLNADPSIRNADLQTQRLKAIIDPLATAIREGALDAAPTRKASAATCLSELAAIAAVVVGLPVATMPMWLDLSSWVYVFSLPLGVTAGVLGYLGAYMMLED